MTNAVDRAERNWLWLALSLPVVAYAAWISFLVVPEVVRVVVPEVMSVLLGR
jgi:hypothetical protein